MNKKSFKVHIFFSAFLFIFPQIAVLPVKQPKGQMPSFRPLLPQPENTKPNISGNIQSQQNFQVQQSSNFENNGQAANYSLKTTDVQKTQNLGLPISKSAKSKTWVWAGLVFIFLSLGSWFFWKKDV